jgi:tetraacyldisaccharide 4'-kinase
MNVSWLLETVSGKRKGLFANSVRGVLWCMTPVYRYFVQRRNRQFAICAKLSIRVAPKVLSIGNITTGGTGKTPMVVWVCELLQREGISVGIVSRGYGAKNANESNDEAKELRGRLPTVPHIQNPDRVAAANQCADENGIRAIVVDDGFQHRRLARDLDIVLIDASNPFGYGYLLPRGLLREPKSSLGRADVIVITRCERVEAAALQELQKVVRNLATVPIALAKTRSISLIDAEGGEYSVDEFRNDSWFVFSAIGNPDAFEDSLRGKGFNICGATRFRDHHHFSTSDLKGIALSAKRAGASKLVCTHKDLVKVGAKLVGDLPVFALKIETEIFEGEDQLTSAILDLFASLESLE